jgi:hypothetical protein
MSRNMRHSLYPEGLLHNRGTPGIKSRSLLTVVSASKFRQVSGRQAFNLSIAIAVPTPPRVHREGF